MNEKFKFIDLFAGIGGFRIAIQNVFNRHLKECECVFTNEWDKYAVQTYNKNFSTNIIPTDIRQINEADIPEHNLLCGGFPCQSFSIAGKRAGFNDTRGTMFFEIARILKSKRPDYLLLENVKGLLNHENGKTFSTILQTLEELGYDVQWLVLNSKFHGVPQNRERVFIVGNLTGKSRSQVLPFKKKYDESINLEFSIEKERKNFLKKNQLLMGVSGVAQTINAQGFGAFGNTGLYDVSKKIKQRTTSPNQDEIRKYITEARKKAGVTIDAIEQHFDNWAGHHWFEKNGSLPSVDDWTELKKLLQFDDKYDELMITYRWTSEWELMNEHKERHQKKGNGFGYQILTGDDNANTLTAMEQGLNYNLVREEEKLNMLGNYQIEAEKREFDIRPEVISAYLSEWLKKSKMTKKVLAEKLKMPFTLVEHFFRKSVSISTPDKETWLKLKEILKFDDKYDKEMTTYVTFITTEHQGNRIYDAESIAPTLNTTTQPIIQDKIIKLGNVNPSGNGQSGTVISEDGISFTITSGGNNPNRNRDCGYGMGRVSTQTGIRKLTPLECERLQGFPDGWTEDMSDTQRYKMLGNAVTVKVIEAIIENWFFRKEEE